MTQPNRPARSAWCEGEISKFFRPRALTTSPLATDHLSRGGGYDLLQRRVQCVIGMRHQFGRHYVSNT